MMNFYTTSPFYRFRSRSCKNCLLAEKCPAIVGKDFSLQWLDLGKVGCHLYQGEFINEIDIKEMLKKIEKFGKTPREILKKYDLTPEEELFIILHVVGGYTQVEAYSIAFSTKARNLAPLASHLLADQRIFRPAQKLADYAMIRNFSVPGKFRPVIETEEEI